MAALAISPDTIKGLMIDFMQIIVHYDFVTVTESIKALELLMSYRRYAEISQYTIALRDFVGDVLLVGNMLRNVVLW